MKRLVKTAEHSIKSLIAASLPLSWYRQQLSRAFRGKDVALCLHRVAEERRSSDPYPDNTFLERDLVALLDLLYEVLPKGSLTITFDDGYEDATQFIDTYASRYQEAKFLVFICPEKIAEQAGFRWDLYEAVGGDFAAVLGSKQQISGENQRLDLKGIAADPRFQLSSVPGLVALTRHRNVSLGNHSNCHFNFARLASDDWQQELKRSFADFRALFGSTEDFAFPFGTPGSQFSAEQAEFIKRHYGVRVWSTGKGGNPHKGDPIYLNRFALPGHHPLKLLLLTMIRHA